jgi:hypothetical protein
MRSAASSVDRLVEASFDGDVVGSGHDRLGMTTPPHGYPALAAKPLKVCARNEVVAFRLGHRNTVGPAQLGTAAFLGQPGITSPVKRNDLPDRLHHQTIGLDRRHDGC